MIAFWVAAALLSAAAAVLIVMRSLRAATAEGEAEDPSLSVYRRQLAEIDDLAGRGLIPDSELRSTRTEAARRLLTAAETAPPPERAAKRNLAIVIALSVVAPLLGLGVYLVVGSPQIPDQPFAARLKTWQADPSVLEPAQMAAVLQHMADQRPKDPQPLVYLARMQMQAGDPVSAEQSLRKALRLDPKDAVLWANLGETLAAESETSDSDGAREAFRHALSIDPTLAGPRYYLARDQIADGDVKGGLVAWQALLNDLPKDDQRRDMLTQQIAQVRQSGGLPQAQAQAQGGQPSGDQMAFIQSMVAKLAAQLQAQPNDPQGWGRLIRAYTVLGDQDKRAAAADRAQALFKDRPDALQQVQAAESAPAAAPN